MEYFTFGTNDYEGRLVEIKVVAAGRWEAEEKVRAILDGKPREVIDIDSGLWLNDYSVY